MNHWAVLGLQPGADAATLKRAFRQQARRWHPDLNGNDPHAEEQFKAVNEAYAVLSDPLRRQRWEAGLDLPDAEAAGIDPFASGFPHFDDYVDALFGRPRRSAAGERPRQDAEPGAWEGNESEQRSTAPDDAAEDPSATPYRRGGDVTASPPPPPPVTASSDCETLVELTPEQALQGERVELELQDGTTVEVWTPPLAGDGWRLRLAGVAPGGADHFLQLRVRTAEGLRIDGLRVHHQLEIAPADGALGCTVVVPTLDGPVQLRVPPGSSSGRLLRLRGRGLEWGGQRGDQLVEIRLVVPQALTDAEEALYRRLQQLAAEIEQGRA
ncbi:MAG: DnaJ domain-containing protein [Vulcanococcus sp.]